MLASLAAGGAFSQTEADKPLGLRNEKTLVEHHCSTRVWEPLVALASDDYLQCLQSLKSRNHQPSSHSKVTFRQPSGTWG
jgi:hypothetical protein